MDVYEKKGYLKDNFRIFHLNDSKKREFQFHYHDFYKILIFIKGNVNYSVEGKTYPLSPYDTVLVSPGEIHRPVVLDNNNYERIILYISGQFLTKELKYCFERAKEHDSHVLRFSTVISGQLYDICRKITEAQENTDVYGRMLSEVKFLEFMIFLNRAVSLQNTQYIPRCFESKVQDITRYINENIKEDLTVDKIAAKFYLSRYHLMHIFKEETGCTLMSYITQKRLLSARSLIANGTSVTSACFEAGFKNYDSFLRAYKKSFNHTPKEK